MATNLFSKLVKVFMSKADNSCQCLLPKVGWHFDNHHCGFKLGINIFGLEVIEAGFSPKLPPLYYFTVLAPDIERPY